MFKVAEFSVHRKYLRVSGTAESQPSLAPVSPSLLMALSREMPVHITQNPAQQSRFLGYKIKPTLRMNLQPRIYPFTVLEFWGKHHAIRPYHGISPVIPVHFQYLEY